MNQRETLLTLEHVLANVMAKYPTCTRDEQILVAADRLDLEPYWCKVVLDGPKRYFRSYEGRLSQI